MAVTNKPIPYVLAPAALEAALTAEQAKKKDLAQKLAKRQQVMQQQAAIYPPQAPPSPLAGRAQNAATAQAQAQAMNPKAQVEAGSALENKFQHSENEPFIMPGYMFDGGEGDAELAVDPHATARARREHGPNHPEIKRQTILNSLKRLKSGLPSFQAASQGALDTAEQRKKLAPFMVGQMDLNPALSFTNSLQGTKFQGAQAQAPAMAAEMAKQAGQSQQERIQLGQLEDKLLDHIIFPKGTSLVTTQGEKQTAQAATPPPVKPTKGGGGADLEKYRKAVDGIAPILQNIKALRGHLKNYKDFGEQSWLEQAATVGANFANTLAPGAGDYAKGAVFSDEQRALDQIKGTIKNLQAYLRSGKTITKEEGVRLAQQLGALDFSSKDALVQGVNAVTLEMEAKIAEAAAAHPEAEKVFRAKGLTSTASTEGLDMNVDDFRYEDKNKPTFKIQTNKKTGEKRKVYSDGRIEAVK